MPSTAATRSPKRCRNSTTAPSPSGATVTSSRASAPRAVSPSTSRLVSMYARAAATGSAGSPLASGRADAVNVAGVPRAFHRARAPAAEARSRCRDVGAARPTRLSLTLASVLSPGTVTGTADAASRCGRRGPAAGTCGEDERAGDECRRGARERTGWCAHECLPCQRLCRSLIGTSIDVSANTGRTFKNALISMRVRMIRGSGRGRDCLDSCRDGYLNEEERCRPTSGSVVA